MGGEAEAGSGEETVPGILVDCGSCPYLPDRRFHTFHLLEPKLGTDRYRRLMDHGFRRSGAHCYRPVCRQCNECRPIRIDVRRFRPRKDQRRCLRRNAGVTVTWQERGLDPERLDLYRRYQRAVHDDDDAEHDPDRFLVEDAGVAGAELHARDDDDGRLLAVSVVDRFDDALSSVYCYYDPDQPRRSLGTFMILAEIARARQFGARWLYLGFLVRGCDKMAYKARFRPHQVLEEEGWIAYP